MRVLWLTDDASTGRCEPHHLREHPWGRVTTGRALTETRVRESAVRRRDQELTDARHREPQGPHEDRGLTDPGQVDMPSSTFTALMPISLTA